MSNIDNVTVTDTIGQKFPLNNCELLCRRDGESDYSDPIAVIFPDGETIILSNDLTLHNQHGVSLALDDVSFDE